uniref:Uncharacterized protein n=1 Tax=Hemiselmis andersenii TaxID=464988 RepID=A0A6U2JF45_HEMAN|mmetsp:Transcript_9090/g.21198  ORF Transcript_9090/g.21198 Transcript_9090/m.21198 type:complete len:147 (+) Transcript_9090:112-552(+)
MCLSKFWYLTVCPSARDPHDVLLEAGVHQDSFVTPTTHNMVCIYLRLDAEASESDVRGRFGVGCQTVDLVEASQAASVAKQIREHGQRVANAQGEEQRGAHDVAVHALRIARAVLDPAVLDEVIFEFVGDVLAEFDISGSPPSSED